MEYIKKEDLIEGEIYTNKDSGNIVKYQFLDNENRICGKFIGGNKNMFQSNLQDHPGRFVIINLKSSTSEEKHWLETCIKLDKFITFEEAMKTFIPGYVECIIEQPQYGNYGKLGKIYKVINWNHSINYCMLEGTTSGSTSKNRFKPSTKEAYDAQFIVKVIKPLPQFKVIETIEIITKVENNEGNQFFIGDIVKSLDSDQKGEITKFRYSADKSNIIAITTFQSNNGIGIDKIEHYIESKVEVKEESLLKKAKRLYPIGTKFKSPSSGNIFTIKNHIQEQCIDQNAIVFPTIEINKDGNYYGCVHIYNKWAERISII